MSEKLVEIKDLEFLLKEVRSLLRLKRQLLLINKGKLSLL